MKRLKEFTKVKLQTVWQVDRLEIIVHLKNFLKTVFFVQNRIENLNKELVDNQRKLKDSEDQLNEVEEDRNKLIVSESYVLKNTCSKKYFVQKGNNDLKALNDKTLKENDEYDEEYNLQIEKLQKEIRDLRVKRVIL